VREVVRELMGEPTPATSTEQVAEETA
jgi:hypothetical protein